VLDGGRAGRLFPTGDAAALGGAVAELLDDADRRAALTACGEQVVANFDWPVVARRVLEVYAAAIEATDGRVMDQEWAGLD
jgi:phosphatidylinositol alpha-mannosyltransferase